MDEKEKVNESLQNEQIEDEEQINKKQDLSEIEILENEVNHKKESVTKSFFNSFVGNKWLFAIAILLFPITTTLSLLFFGFKLIKASVSAITTHIKNKKNNYVNLQADNINLEKNRMISEKQREFLYKSALSYLNDNKLTATKLVKGKNNEFSIFCINEDNEEFKKDFLGKENNQWKIKTTQLTFNKPDENKNDVQKDFYVKLDQEYIKSQIARIPLEYYFDQNHINDEIQENSNKENKIIN